MSIESFIEFGKAAEKAATELGDLSQALDVVSQTPCFTTPLWKENPSVMLSIKPQYCELIASGRKTIEVRKTRPKTETPFKCYIYETKGKTDTPFMDEDGHLDFHGRGQVIGEFICDFIAEFEGEFWDNKTYEDIREKYEPSDFAEYGEYEYQIIAQNGEANWLCKKSCLDWEELRKYIGQGINDFYGWHISDLVIYDKPKELREFKKPCEKTNLCYPDNCNRCGWNILLRPPQSWFYIEALENT